MVLAVYVGLGIWAAGVSAVVLGMMLKARKESGEGGSTPGLGWMGIAGGWLDALIFLGIVVLVARWLGIENAYLQGMMRKAPLMAGIVGGALLGLLYGYWDDRRVLSPAMHVLLQASLGLFLYCLGVRITVFSAEWMHAPCTILWVLTVCNAMNLLDHADGVCAGVAAIACACFLIVAIAMGQFLISMLLIVLLGALLGFLPFNLPPARTTMGNAGSFFVGYVLSATTILETFYAKGISTPLAVLMPVLLLAVPAYDVAFVVLLRLAQGRPMWRGDENHLGHRLRRAGYSDRHALGIVYGLTLATGLCAAALPFASMACALLSIAAVLVALSGMGFWEWRQWRKR